MRYGLCSPESYNLEKFIQIEVCILGSYQFFMRSFTVIFYSNSNQK